MLIPVAVCPRSHESAFGLPSFPFAPRASRAASAFAATCFFRFSLAISNSDPTISFSAFTVSSSTSFSAAITPFMLFFHSAVKSIRLSACEAVIT